MKRIPCVILGACLLAALAAAPSGAASPSKQLSDSELRATLVAMYVFTPHLSDDDLQIEVRDSEAYISGSVSSDIEQDLVGEVARALEGIEAVHNDVSVRGNGTKAPRPHYALQAGEVRDANLRANVRSKLRWNRNTSKLPIKVAVDKRVATLAGVVPTEEQEVLALLLAANTPGIRRVVDQLRVEAQQGTAPKMPAESQREIDDHTVTIRVKAALLFSSEALGSDIHVDTNEGVVTLSGMVASQEQRREIIELVRDIEGVRRVVDHLEPDSLLERVLSMKEG